MKVPKLGISDKYITFFFSISKKLTKTSKSLITSEVKTMTCVWKPIPWKEPNSTLFVARIPLSFRWVKFFRITWIKWLNMFSWLAKCRLIFLLTKKGKKRHSWLGTRLFGRNPGLEKPLMQLLNVKILAGYCILISSSSWLWGADIVLPEKLIISQKTISDCSNITGSDIQSLWNFSCWVLLNKLTDSANYPWIPSMC